jgi:hypothetical protein
METVATILAIMGAMLWVLAVTAGFLMERLQDERRVISYREFVESGKPRPSAARRTG